jgi:hypothetical protein
LLAPLLSWSFVIWLAGSAYLFCHPGRDREATVRIDEGDTLSTVAAICANSGYRNDRPFLLCALELAEKKIHWGLYRFDSPCRLRSADRLVTGLVSCSVLPFPRTDGRQIANFSAKANRRYDKFLAETENPQPLAALDLGQVEGYCSQAPTILRRELLSNIGDDGRTVSQSFRPLFEQVMTASR